MALSMKLEIASNRRSRSPSTGTLPLLANLTRGTAPSSALTRPPAAKTRRGAVLVDEFLRLLGSPRGLRDRGRVALDGSSSDHDRPNSLISPTNAKRESRLGILIGTL